jgi:type VI secretion system protein ImpK
VEEALQPYVFLLDELVLRRLCEAEQPLWPLLQQRLFGMDSGGDLFFDQAEARLEHADTPPLLFEVLFFCLLAGFEGRYADNAAKLHEYRERIKARIPRPQPPGAAAASPEVQMMPIYEFPMRYYLVTGFVVVALPVLLWWLSNN